MRTSRRVCLLASAVGFLAGCSYDGPIYTTPPNVSPAYLAQVKSEGGFFPGESISIESIDALPVYSRSYTDGWVGVPAGRHAVEVYFLSGNNGHYITHTRGTLHATFQAGHRYVFTIERSFIINPKYVLALEDRTAKKTTYFPKNHPRGTTTNPFK